MPEQVPEQLETDEILADPETMRAIAEGEADLEAGRVVPEIPEYGPDCPAAVVTVHAFKDGRCFVTSEITDDPDDPGQTADIRTTELTELDAFKTSVCSLAADIAGIASIADSLADTGE